MPAVSSKQCINSTQPLHETKKKKKKQKKQPTLNCAICLNDIHDENDRYDLDCDHTFHGSCLTQWFKANTGEKGYLHMPYQDMKHLLFFSSGRNCFGCPICRVEYTKEMVVVCKVDFVNHKPVVDESKFVVCQKDTTVKKVLGKINILDCNTLTVVTHYVTDPKTFRHFEPVIEMDDEDSNSTITLYKRK
jgi:hypothetical protein